LSIGCDFDEFQSKCSPVVDAGLPGGSLTTCDQTNWINWHAAWPTCHRAEAFSDLEQLHNVFVVYISHEATAAGSRQHKCLLWPCSGNSSSANGLRLCTEIIGLWFEGHTKTLTGLKQLCSPTMQSDQAVLYHRHKPSVLVETADAPVVVRSCGQHSTNPPHQQDTA
jgi:hypothetical protein